MNAPVLVVGMIVYSANGAAESQLQIWTPPLRACELSAMSMPKTGARRIVVDDVAFRWRVRSRPTYAEGNAWRPLTATVEPEAGRGLLVIVFEGSRPDNWMGEPATVATPGAVASAIRQAIAAGWRLEGSERPAFFNLTSGRLGPSLRSALDTEKLLPPRDRHAEWEPYDPTWLIGLAEAQYPDEWWLAGALATCCAVFAPTPLYIHFADPKSVSWRFSKNIMLDSPEHGTLVLDILEGDVVGGVEFPDRL